MLPKLIQDVNLQQHLFLWPYTAKLIHPSHDQLLSKTSIR